MKAIATLGLTMAIGAQLAAANLDKYALWFTQCNGYRRPNYDDCDSVIDWFKFKDNTDTFHTNGEQGWPKPSCKWWYWEDGNCRITNCFNEAEAIGGGPPYSINGLTIDYMYQRLKGKCVDWRAGGTEQEVVHFIDVFNDEDQPAAPPALRNVKRSGGFVEGESSLEEYRAYRNSTGSVHGPAAPSSRRRRRSSPQAERRDAAVAAAAKALGKRQGLDGDNDFEIAFAAIGVRKPNTQAYGPRMSPGVGYNWESEESHSFSVSTSISMGGTWPIFSASMGFEMSETDSFSVKEGLTFDVQCPKAGQVVFYPFYDYFEVQFKPSLTWVNIWVPVVNPDKKVDGEIVIHCQG